MGFWKFSCEGSSKTLEIQPGGGGGGGVVKLKKKKSAHGILLAITSVEKKKKNLVRAVASELNRTFGDRCPNYLFEQKQ